MYAIRFIVFISLVVKENLDMLLMNVVTIHLYGSVKDIKSLKYIIQNLEICILSCMWYNRFSEKWLKEGFENNPICPCIFIKKVKIQICYFYSICG